MSEITTAATNSAADLNEASAAYMAMLRRIHEMSGLTAGQISMYAGLPRSTAYRFVDAKNTVVPKNRDQVEAFLHGCRTPQSSVDRMLELWDDINGVSRPQAVPVDDVLIELAPDDDPLSPKTKTADARRREWDEEQYSRTNIRPTRRRSTPASAAQSQPPRDDELTVNIAPSLPVRTHDDPCVCLDLMLQQQDSNESPTPMWSRFLLVFAPPLLLFLCTLYPLVAAMLFGRHGTSGSIGMASAALLVILLGVACALDAWHSSLLTPSRLIGALLGGICSALLSWATMPALPTAVLTGFAVFIVTPTWFVLTDWTSITTVRGAFASIAAFWFGLTMGAAVFYIGMPSAGSILVAALAAAAALSVLCGQTPSAEEVETAWTRLRARAPYASGQHHPTTQNALKRMRIRYSTD